MAKYKGNKNLKKLIIIVFIVLIFILLVCVMSVNKLEKSTNENKDELVLTDPVYINEEKR